MKEFELLLLHHGKTRSGMPESGDRVELKSSSKRRAQKLGNWMREQNLKIQTPLSGPNSAAVVSAEKALKAGGWSARDIRIDARFDASDVSQNLAALHEHARNGNHILLSASPPALTRLMGVLLPAGNRLRPNSIARLNVSLSDTGKLTTDATLIAAVHADDLPDGFPYSKDGKGERRKRPTYYYTQSAALPFRWRDGQPEILLITSSRGRRWGIPKGICEPGLTPQQSAQIEAREEAGILGDIGEASIGTYHVKKWGNQCEVTVYPMKVTQQFDEQDWEEPHRRREWLSPTEAGTRVYNQDLQQLITQCDYLL